MKDGLLVQLFQHNNKSNGQEKPLHFAIKMGNIDHIKTLLANGADLYEVDSVCIAL